MGEDCGRSDRTYWRKGQPFDSLARDYHDDWRLECCSVKDLKLWLEQYDQSLVGREVLLEPTRKSFCHDCTRDFQKEMLDSDRCVVYAKTRKEIMR
mgnify:CR=1 FL=1